jgi:ribosomal protein L37AE/L43A
MDKKYKLPCPECGSTFTYSRLDGSAVCRKCGNQFQKSEGEKE